MCIVKKKEERKKEKKICKKSYYLQEMKSNWKILYQEAENKRSVCCVRYWEKFVRSFFLTLFFLHIYWYGKVCVCVAILMLPAWAKEEKKMIVEIFFTSLAFSKNTPKWIDRFYSSGKLCVYVVQKRKHVKQKMKGEKNNMSA